ncbi:MAG: hypothetical protein JO094_06415, partial [Hyphomicrobiales bacterium]|nr:hypothetical protein [Hyphomicrobiales bacterium]
SSIAWSSTFTRRARRYARKSGRSCSSPPITRRSCPTPFCAAAFSTTSSSPMPRRCATSSRCIFPVSKSVLSKRPCASSSKFARCPD